MNTSESTSSFTMFPNDLLEAIYSTNFNATQKDILHLVVRYTYGFHRESHSLALEFIAKGINKTKGNVQKQLKELIKCNVIIEVSKQKGTESRMLKVNTNYHSWKKFKVSRIETIENDEDRVVQSDYPRVVQSDYSRVVLSDHQERNNLNKNLKKSSYSDEFEEFFREYPRSENKPVTHHEWKKATREHDPKDITRAAKNYKRAKADTDATYIHTSYNFLKKGEYLNHLQQNETKKPIPDFDEENWL